MEVPFYVRYLSDRRVEVSRPDQPEKSFVVDMDQFVSLDDDLARNLGQFVQGSVMSQWLRSKSAAPDLVEAILLFQSSPNRLSPEQKAGFAIQNAIAERIVRMIFSSDHLYKLDDFPKLFDAAVVLGVEGAERYAKSWPSIRSTLAALALEEDEEKRKPLREQVLAVIAGKEGGNNSS